SATAEFRRYRLRVQQSKLDGWWFIFVDEVPGLGVVGPNFEDLLGRLKVLAGNLFRARGEPVAEIEIVRSENPALHVFFLTRCSKTVAERWPATQNLGRKRARPVISQACCPCLVRSIASSAASSESITNAARCCLGFLSNQVH